MSKLLISCERVGSKLSASCKEVVSKLLAKYSNPKYFLKFYYSTRLRSKVFSLESLWFKIFLFGWSKNQIRTFWVKKNGSENFLSLRKFFVKNISFQKNVCPNENFGTKIIFGSRKVLVQKNLVLKKIFGPKKFLGSKKILGPKKY